MRLIRIEPDQFNFPLRDDSEQGLGLHDGEIPMSDEMRDTLLDWNDRFLWALHVSKMTESERQEIIVMEDEATTIAQAYQEELDRLYPNEYQVSYDR
jgi:hypothetical protein